MKIRDMTGNEIIEMARFALSDEAVEIVLSAVLDRDGGAIALLSPYMELAEEYVQKGQIIRE